MLGAKPGSEHRINPDCDSGANGMRFVHDSKYPLLIETVVPQLQLRNRRWRRVLRQRSPGLAAEEIGSHVFVRS